MEYPKSDYKEYPKTLAPDDFWGQVRRTVYGEPVADEQIGMMHDAIRQGLSLQKQDVMLDIGCGNGMLAQFLFDECSGYRGVDFSEYLISVGQKNFSRPGYDFVFSDAIAYAENEADPLRFNKALCFAVLSYLDDEQSHHLLQTLAQRFARIEKLFMGNMPDPELAHRFFKDGVEFSKDIQDPASQIGKWRSRQELADLAARSGWQLTACPPMPEAYYQSHYRYNAILERK